MLLPSVLGLALCFVCLAATTWAWFVVSVTSEANTIQTASFGVEMTVNGNPVAADANGSYTLPTGTYSVTMSKTGDANGYFDFKVGEKQYRTTAITANTPITITIQNNRTSPIICSFTSYWGTPEGATNVGDEIVTFNAVLPPEIISITDGDTIIVGEPSEDPADETQQEEGAEDEKKDESSPDENNPADDSENNGEGENTSTDTPAEGEGGQTSTPTEGEGEQQGGDPIVEGEPSSSNVGDNTGGEPSKGGETGESNVPADTADTADTTDPTAQSEGGVPTDPAPTE